MIVLAHDGSLYGDWVARYAIRFAAEEADRSLLLLHVEDGRVSPEIVEERFHRLSGECDSLNVILRQRILPRDRSVYRSLLWAIPPDPDALLVCGTRVKPRKEKYLAGSVSEKLLRMRRCPVLALRVVQPGLLGHPRSLLLPLAGHRVGFDRFRPVFCRILPALRCVHLFRSLYLNRLRHPHLSPARERILKEAGLKYLSAIDEEIERFSTERTFALERRVSISSDWVRDVLTQANRLKVQLMLLGVTERSLAHRVFHGAGIEKILHETPCDVGVYRGP